MAHIKEPTGIDFIVDPTPISEDEKLRISELIAYYKKTGKKKSLVEKSGRIRLVKTRNKTSIAKSI